MAGEDNRHGRDDNVCQWFSSVIAFSNLYILHKIKINNFQMVNNRSQISSKQVLGELILTIASYNKYMNSIELLKIGCI